MDINELLELRARLWSAKVYKHLIAIAESYTERLENLVGPVNFNGTRHSVDHLLALVEKAIRVHDAPKPPRMDGKPTAKDSPKMVVKPETRHEPEPKTSVKPEPKTKASDSR